MYENGRISATSSEFNALNACGYKGLAVRIRDWNRGAVMILVLLSEVLVLLVCRTFLSKVWNATRGTASHLHALLRTVSAP